MKGYSLRPQVVPGKGYEDMAMTPSRESLLRTLDEEAS